MTHRAGRRAGLLLAVLAMAGCATAPAPQAGWVSGRLSVRVDATATEPASSLSAAFELRGSGDTGELRLSTPLGARLAQARWSPGEAVLDTGSGDRRYADLDSLSRDAVGQVLPLQALPDWLAGRPWARAAQVAREGGFEQLGWRVRVAGRADGRIEAERMAPPRVVVRVVIDPPAS